MSARQSEIKIKLNLEKNFALWISNLLLRLTSVEAQTIFSFIFFYKLSAAMITWPKVVKENTVQVLD